MDERVAEAEDFLLGNPNASIRGPEKNCFFFVWQDVPRKQESFLEVLKFCDGFLLENQTESYVD